VAQYEIALPVGQWGSQNGFEYIESTLLMDRSPDEEGWDLQASPLVTMQSGEPKCRLSLLLRHSKNPKLLAAKDGSITRRLRLQLTH